MISALCGNLNFYRRSEYDKTTNFYEKDVTTLAVRILIIEDEEKIARVLQLELQFEGYEAAMVHSGADGLLAFHDESWDLVLLDWMLPEMSGLEVLKRIRKQNETTPIILLTAKGEIADKVTALDAGANDYVTKPFEFEELLARIRVALRFAPKVERKDAANENVLTFGDLTVNEQTYEAFVCGDRIDFTKREFELLLHLMKHPNLVQSRDQLLNAVWGFDYYGDTNVVDVYIRYVRQKLAAVGKSYIQTVRGVGYVLRES